MKAHISTSGGLHKALHHAFELVQARPISEPTHYYNCTSPETLRNVVARAPFPWTQTAEKLHHFHYEHVTDLLALHEKIAMLEDPSNLIIIERLDHIVLQPSGCEYYRQNEMLAATLRRMENVIFLDDWGYLERYYV